jgi:hypothetical protein
MTVWVLVATLFIQGEFKFMGLGVFATMNECFTARDYFIATGPQPKINYEAVCVQTNQLEVL